MSKETGYFLKIFILVTSFLKIIFTCVTPFVFLFYGYKYGIAHIIFVILFILTTHVDNGKKD